MDHMSELIITGVFGLRSSRPNFVGVAGESEIQLRNPQRVEKILSITGWPRLQPGTANLEVGEEAAEKLLALEPEWVEDGSTVVYPPGLQHIPLDRIAYLYFRGIAKRAGKTQEVLIRRAKKPAVVGRIELFAPISLTTYFALTEGKRLEVKINVP